MFEWRFIDFIRKMAFQLALDNWHPSEQKLEVEEIAYCLNWVFSYYLNFFARFREEFGMTWRSLFFFFKLCLKIRWNLHIVLKVWESQHVAQIVVLNLRDLNKTGRRGNLPERLEAVIMGYETCTLKGWLFFYISCPFFAVLLLFSLLEFVKDLVENSDLSQLLWRKVLKIRCLLMFGKDFLFVCFRKL